MSGWLSAEDGRHLALWERADGGRQRIDIRHSDERTRQWSTARRLVSMVESMTATLEGFAVLTKLESRMVRRLPVF